MRYDLTVRLKMIADLASRYKVSGRLIDVGADHGLLSVYCLKNDVFTEAVLTDINEGPLSRADEAIRSNLLSEKASTMLTDGLDGVEVNDGDVIVIAGMGGLNIKDIIGRFIKDHDSIPKDITFILQPQKSIPELREWLYGNGFVIDNEEACFETGFYYCVLSVKYSGKELSLSDREIYYGPVMLTKFERYPEYKAFLDRVYQVRARGDKRIRDVLEGME